MILPDVNVLIYAFRSDAIKHAAYKRWLESIVYGPAAFGMSPQVLSAVVRICTHPRIFANPTPVPTALTFCRTLLAQPNVSIVEPGPRHWPLFEEMCERSGATGNLVADAWFAALAVESGCEWVTTDRDYARFPGLRWSTPPV